MARVKYNGTNKAKVSWNSMGKAFSYNVRPGEVIAIPDDQVNNIRAAGSFSIISAPNMGKPKVIKKVIKKETPIKVVKPVPVVEPDPEPVEEPVEDAFEDIDTESETKVLSSAVEDVEEGEDLVDTEEEEDKSVDYTSIRKSDLKDMCKERGLHISGNRDDLIARLVAFDKGIILDQ
jgi:hypothetical protein